MNCIMLNISVDMLLSHTYCINKYINIACVSDLDECEADFDWCEQLCYNNEGSFTCGCYEGYELLANDFSCTGTFQ